VKEVTKGTKATFCSPRTAPSTKGLDWPTPHTVKERMLLLVSVGKQSPSNPILLISRLKVSASLLDPLLYCCSVGKAALSMTYFNLELGGKKRDEKEARPKPSLDLLSRRLGNAASTELSMPLCVTCSCQTSYKGKDLDLTSSDSDYKCQICLDPRQYIGTSGQKWTTLKNLISDQISPRYNDFDEMIPGSLWTFKTRPSFGIGQRAFLIKDPSVKGLIMWDCVAYLDDSTLEKIDQISEGHGISHTIVSHPHYYSTTATWAAAFPSMTLWLAQEDFQKWYQRDELMHKSSDGGVGSRISLVKKEQTVIDSAAKVKILLLGGHFPGSLVLLWNDILFIADTIQVVPSALYKSDQPQRPGVTSVTFLWR
jgi:hypothetical protein